ncbi:MAG: DUF4956 domain-containing protein [gamma proteobacterium symbiont of Taylorina sp.]|nr:DUF4956 domain-containing protein [gamma proteobacterium symbiont of Taylorina sp.]
MENQLVEAMSGVFNYTPFEVILNSFLALILGLVISYTYKKTHQGLSYSQSFVLTVIFITIIIGIVMMVIGNSLARAFALVGALSIIRFRTVVKDTKDTAYVFMALAVGMAAGTGNYFIAVYATAFLSGVAWVLFKFNYGVQRSSDFILRFYFDKTADSDDIYVTFINDHSDNNALLHMEPSGDGKNLYMTYDISLKEDINMNNFIDDFSKIGSVSEVVLVSAKNDITY